ncbi:hypothetical protein ACFLVC_05095 [Chloroflexota bacterium]
MGETTLASLFQITFYLSLALLAILITVFVLAVSLLGRAIRISLDEQKKTEQEQQEQASALYESIEGKLNIAKEEGKGPNIDSLTKSLREAKKQMKKHGRRLIWIRWKPKFLKTSWGIFIPGSFFIASIVFSALSLQFQTSPTMSLSLWILSLITMFSGVALICLILKVIESVAVTSDETSFIRQKEMMVSALTEVEEGKKPSFVLQFGETLPIDIKSDEVSTIHLYIQLTKGSIARKPKAMFFLPEGFEAPNNKTIVQRDHIPTIGGLLSFDIDFIDCTKAFSPSGQIVLKAPSTKGAYTIFYKVGSEEFDGKLGNFIVNVV